MAYLEIQIATSSLYQAFQQLLLPRLYAQCFVVPIPPLVLDHVAVGTFGPTNPTVPGTMQGVTVPFGIQIYLVDRAAVIAANGLAPATPPPIPQVTGKLSLTMAGTTLTVNYDGIEHNADYFLLEGVVAGALNGDIAQAQTLFTTWEQDAENALGGAPLLSYDCGASLPGPLANLQFGRSVVSADPDAIAIRLEIGAPGSDTDGDWLPSSPFLGGALDSQHLQGYAWSLFVTADAVTQIVDAQINSFAPGFNAAETAPSVWAPQGQTAAVNSSLGATFPVHVLVFSGNVPVTLSVRTTFTEVPGPALRTDISYDYTIQGGFPGLVENAIAHIFGAGNSIPAPQGYTKVGNREFYTDSPIPNQAVANGLTLSASSVLGLADGMLIAGHARIAQAGLPPDCFVQSVPFKLIYVTSCTAMRSHQQQPETQENVAATASFSVSESFGPPFQIPLVIGGFQMVVPDPQEVYTPFLPAVPQWTAATFNFTITVPGLTITIFYGDAPYPCQFIVLTSGGARYVSLGEINPLKIVNGMVTNADPIYLNDCHDGPINQWLIAIAVMTTDLVDPPPEGAEAQWEAVASTVVEALAGGSAANALPVSVGGVQIGAVAAGFVAANQVSQVGPGALVAATLLGRAAALQSASRLAEGAESEE